MSATEDIYGATFRPLNPDESASLNQAREQFIQIGDMLNTLGPSREMDLARARLEESMMWTTKHIALRGIVRRS